MRAGSGKDVDVDVAVSPKKEDPNIDPNVVESSLWGPPQKGTPHFGKPPKPETLNHVDVSICSLRLPHYESGPSDPGAHVPSIHCAIAMAVGGLYKAGLTTVSPIFLHLRPSALNPKIK